MKAEMYQETYNNDTVLKVKEWLSFFEPRIWLQRDGFPNQFMSNLGEFLVVCEDHIIYYEDIRFPSLVARLEIPKSKEELYSIFFDGRQRGNPLSDTEQLIEKFVYKIKNEPSTLKNIKTIENVVYDLYCKLHTSHDDK